MIIRIYKEHLGAREVFGHALQGGFWKDWPELVLYSF